MRRIPDGVQLRARAHSACVSAPVTVEPGMSYRLHVEARTVSGLAARLRVWQDGPDRCAEVSDMPIGRDWTSYQARFEVAPDTRAVRVYVYADGSENPETVTEYRGLDVVPAVPRAVAITRVDDRPREPLPRVRWHQRNPARYDVEVRGARRPFLLALAESYAPGWTIEGLPPRAGVEHVRADGYANAWRIDARGDFDLVLAYRPADLGRAGLQASLAGAAAGALVAVVRSVRRRRRRARRAVGLKGNAVKGRDHVHGCLGP